MACPAIDDAAFLRSVLAHVDCQARSLGDDGYHALSQPGSIGATLIVAALTLFIAIFGYRLLLGDRISPREMILGGVKLGFALVLATNWPAVKIIAYNVVLDGPSQLAQQIGNATAIPGLAGDLADRLQLIDWELDEIDQRGSGAVTPDTAGETATATNRRVDMTRDLSWLGFARIIFLTATIASLALVRFAGGILLALAPIFALMLLFDSMRGLFIGWVRGLIAITLGGLFVTLALGLELALLEPWLAAIVGLRRAMYATPAAPVELMVIALVFAGAMAGLLYLAMRIAQGLAETLRIHIPEWAGASVSTTPQALSYLRDGGAQSETGTSIATRSRALAVADAVTRNSESYSGQRTISPTSMRASLGRTESQSPAAAPLGQSFRRRTQGRASTAMARRNRS